MNITWCPIIEPKCPIFRGKIVLSNNPIFFLWKVWAPCLHWFSLVLKTCPPTTISNYVLAPIQTCALKSYPHVHLSNHTYSCVATLATLVRHNYYHLSINMSEISGKKILGEVFSWLEISFRCLCTEILPPPPFWSCALKFCLSNCLHSTSQVMCPRLFHRTPLPYIMTIPYVKTDSIQISQFS